MTNPSGSCDRPTLHEAGCLWDAAGMTGKQPRIRRLPRGAWVAFGLAALIGFALLGVDNRWAHLVSFLLPALTLAAATRLLERK
jgi:hypothetical protein